MLRNAILVALLSSLYLLIGCAATQTEKGNPLIATRVSHAPQIDGAIDAIWDHATPLVFTTDWRGRPTATATQVRALWLPDGLYLLWELQGAGLANTDHRFLVQQQRDKLYEEDCVEFFWAPNPALPNQYAEIEVGPYGHFLDLWIDQQARQYDATWSAGLQVAAQQDPSERSAVIELAITSPSLVAALVAGAQFPIGLYRLEGAQPRQYLAAFPTQTLRPNFHVPEAFGTLVLSP